MEQTVVTGRDCTKFLEFNFDNLEIVEAWMNTDEIAALPYFLHLEKRTAITEKRLLGAKRSGTLSVQEGFRILAWAYRLNLTPGFLEDEARCDVA